jgi:hypothetical protein
MAQMLTGQQNSWDAALKAYRKHVYMQAEAHTKKGVAIAREKIAEVLKNGGKLSFVDLLLCKTRYFTDGAVFGSQVFVEDFFQNHRELFGRKRKTGARKPKLGGLVDIFIIRDLRKDAVSISPG